MIYPVNEIFQTIQGEGNFTGTPALFVRLQGCPVGCPWCDTQHTWHVLPEQRIPVTTMLAKTQDSQQYSELSEKAILDVFVQRKFTARHVVITGGEPCMHDLLPLTDALLQDGYTVQIETSGTFPVRVATGTWVTLSPKIDMKGGYPILDKALQRADEIKHPVARQRDVEALDSLLARMPLGHHPLVSLQPVSQGRRATELCIATCIARNWRLSLQVHKYLGIE